MVEKIFSQAFTHLTVTNQESRNVCSSTSIRRSPSYINTVVANEIRSYDVPLPGPQLAIKYAEACRDRIARDEVRSVGNCRSVTIASNCWLCCIACTYFEKRPTGCTFPKAVVRTTLVAKCNTFKQNIYIHIFFFNCNDEIKEWCFSNFKFLTSEFKFKLFKSYY